MGTKRARPVEVEEEDRAVDVAVLTVIPAELEAARLALGIDDDRARETAEDGTVYFRGTMRSELAGRDYTVAVTCIGGAGNPVAAVAAANAVGRYRPRALLLMGIAAGVRGKIRIGDVVLSERVVAYEPAALVRGAAGSAVQPRPEIDRAPHAIIQAVVAYRADAERLREVFVRAKGAFPAAPAGREAEFREHVASSIAARLATIASGEKLLRDPAKLIALREDMHGKIEAGEMEAAGVVEACRRGKVPWLVIRGISDFGDELKDDRFHAFAAHAAAAVLVDFMAWGLDLGPVHVKAAVQETRKVVLKPAPSLVPQFRLNLPAPPAIPRDESDEREEEEERPSNPFIFGRPIDDDGDFYGRHDEKR